MSAETVIRAQGVAKRYGAFDALVALDLEVRRGECVGLLGPNGAGKSTFIGCLYGVVLRTGGRLEIFGHDPAREARAIKRRIGVVPQENALDEGLTVLENMQIYARFGGLSHATAAGRIVDLLAHMALETKRDAPIKTLSGGMKRRLTFVRALFADPELLILDEPTTGLDPSVRHLLWDKVTDLRDSGKTVLVTTHYMHEAEVLCDRIVVLNKGSVPPDSRLCNFAPPISKMYTSNSPDGSLKIMNEHANPCGWRGSSWCGTGWSIGKISSRTFRPR